MRLARCCLLAALLGQAPRCIVAFVPQSLGNVLGHQVKAALSSLSTLKAMGDVYENFESKATRDHDHYMASLKRREAYPQEQPPSLSRNEQELLNEQAKARIEAYKRGEIPPPSPPVVPQPPAQWSSPAAVPFPPPAAPAGQYPAYTAQPYAHNAPQPAYPAQPGAPNAPQGYYYPPPQPGPYPLQAPPGPYPSAPAVPTAPPQPQYPQQQPQEPVRLSPSGEPYPPGFNPTFWQDFFRAQQEKEAADKAADEGGESEPQGAGAALAAQAPAAAISTPAAPARHPLPPPAAPSPPSPQSAPPVRDDTPGGSRFRAVFEAQKSAGTGNSPRDRLKQWLLSKYPPEDQSEQAIQYRRYIEANDMGYTGQYGQDDAYLTQLKQDSKQKLKQQGYAPGAAQPPARASGAQADPYGPPVGSQGPSPYGQPPAPGAPTPGAGAPYAANPPAPPAAPYPGQGPPQFDQYGYPQTPYYPPPLQPAPVDPYYGYYQPPPQGPVPYMGQPVPPPPPAFSAPPSPPQAIAPPAAPVAPRYVQPEPQPQRDPVGRATRAVEAPSEATPALESSIRELMGYLYKHRGGPGFGAGRLKSSQEIQRLETLLDEVKAGLYAETDTQGDGAVDEGDKQVLLTAADGLRRLAAQGRKGGVQEVLTAVLKAVATVEGWRGAEQESAAAAPASLATQSRPAAGQAEKAVVADESQAPQVTKPEVAVAGGETEGLSDELRRKLQGTMALSLKHSGALGKGTGPLQGEELDLLKSSLTEVSAALRKESEAAYGQSIETYLRENDLGDAPVTIQSVQSSTAPAAAVPKPSKVAVSYKEQLALARQKKAERQKQ